MKNIFPNYNKTILIVTLGRTGSTLLQGIINSIPGANIRGENAAFGQALYNMYKVFLKWKKFSIKPVEQTTHPWYGANVINTSILFKDMRNLFFNQLYPGGSNSHILGFKEIRYSSNSFPPEYHQNFFALLDFYQNLFTNVYFIFNSRDAVQVAKSGWWKKKDPCLVKEYLKDFECAADLYLQQNNGKCYFIRYEDVIYKTNKLLNLFDFIGEEYDEIKINHVLSVKHSTSG